MANEKRLIDVNKVINSMQKCLDEASDKNSVAYLTFEALIECMKQEPTVDAVEVVHGRWNEKQEQIPWCEDDVDTYWMCSVCGAIEIGKTNYCHNCGAKMDGERRSG